MSETIRTLTARHRQCVPLVAVGLPDSVVAERSGYHPAQIDRLRRNRAFQQLVADYLAIASDGLVEAVHLLLTRDTIENLGFLQDVRRGKFAKQPAESMRLRVQASLGLLDRQIPKRTEVKQDNTLIFRISAEDRKALQGVMDEARALPPPVIGVAEIDVTPDAEVVATTPEDVPAV